MIPNTELRIGNNVLYADKIAVVKSIQAHKVCISVNNRYIKCSYEDIFPIVLTEELIIDLGFLVHGTNPYWFKKNNICVSIIGVVEIVNNLKQNVLLQENTNVHKLQNIYADIIQSSIKLKE